MTFEGEKYKELLEINLTADGLIEALKTVVALVNTNGGILIFSECSIEKLARFVRALDEEIKPSIKVSQIAKVSRAKAASLIFVFDSAEIIHKLRGFGTFVRKEGKNKRLSPTEKNALIKRRSLETLGQRSLFKLEDYSEQFNILDSAEFYRSLVPISDIQSQIAELFERWEEPKDVFISYSRPDHSIAHALKCKLEDTGLSVWMDENSLQVGDKLTIDIGKGISRSKIGVIFVSNNSKESKWVKTEISLMLFKRQFSDKNFVIIPVKVDDTPMLEELSEIIFAELTEDTEIKTSKLANRIKYLISSQVKDYHLLGNSV